MLKNSSHFGGLFLCVKHPHCAMVRIFLFVIPFISLVSAQNKNSTNVRNVKFSSNSTSATLSWDPPLSIPLNSSEATYRINDDKNGISKRTKQRTVVISNLIPFHRYNISITLYARDGTRVVAGTPVFIPFWTDVAAPGAVQNLEVVQKPNTQIFHVSWQPPKSNETNGPISYYKVRIFDYNGRLLRNVFSRSAGSLDTTKPDDHHMNRVNYTFTVNAVNTASNRKELIGKDSSRVVQFIGIDPPKGLQWLNRTSQSIMLRILPSTQSRTKSGNFYIVTTHPSSKVIETKSLEVNITGLQPFTNITVYVRNCIKSTFCSEPISGNFKTNVGAPSSVQNLQATVAGVTLTDVQLSWDKPKIKNGLIDGYNVELVDLNEDDKKYTYTLPGNMTSLQFNSSEEYEMYSVSVTPFNVDLDKSSNRLIGPPVTEAIETIGTRPPRPYVLKQNTFNPSSVEFSWQSVVSEQWKVLWFHIEVESLKVDTFTNETSMTLTGLRPNQELKISIQGCTTKSLEKCSFPRLFYRSTSAGSKSGIISAWLAVLIATLIVAIIIVAGILYGRRKKLNPSGAFNRLFNYRRMGEASDTQRLDQA